MPAGLTDSCLFIYLSDVKAVSWSLCRSGISSACCDSPPCMAWKLRASGGFEERGASGLLSWSREPTSKISVLF